MPLRLATSETLPPLFKLSSMTRGFATTPQSTAVGEFQ